MLIKKKYSKPVGKNYWVFLRMNIPLTKKSKNARMGKGKGSLYRWAMRLPRNFKIIEFRNINSTRLSMLAKKWSKKIGLPLVFSTKIDF